MYLRLCWFLFYGFRPNIKIVDAPRKRYLQKIVGKVQRSAELLILDLQTTRYDALNTMLHILKIDLMTGRGNI